MSSPSMPPGPVLPFTPRKEFLRDQQASRNSFALLAISSSHCVRLYSFAPKTVQSIRHLLSQYSTITTSREDASQSLCEFALDRRPWSNPKSVSSEKLLVDILAVIYFCGYSYLSTINYGREEDDRLAIAFSRIDSSPPSSTRSPLTIPSSSTKDVVAHDQAAASSIDQLKPTRVPFAISFASVTVMRVIAPPLHLTPAILQAVRSSWPRGVVSEKSCGEDSFEFKLKGYRWFQQDTFATDSLRHILSLLSSLDTHSFSLLSSISLSNNRSRVKDLWIFTGPASEEAPATSEESLLEKISLRRTSKTSPFTSESLLNINPPRRVATEPSTNTPHSPLTQHARAATEGSPRPSLSQGHNVLRKNSPRAQVPVSAVSSLIQDNRGPEDNNYVHIPSTISDNTENMTGVGSGGHTPNIFYSTSPYGASAAHNHEESTGQVTEAVAIINPQKGPQPSDTSPGTLTDMNKTPPALSSSPLSQPSSSNSKPVTPPVESDSTTPHLLGGAFRDSAFSSNSEISYEIPIMWTGPLGEELQELKEEQESEQSELNTEPSRVQPSRLSSTPLLPGAWQPTPISEKAEEEYQAELPDTGEEQKQSVSTPIQELDSRVSAPEIVQPDVALRRSEAALVGMIHATNTPSTIPSDQNTPATPNGQGWVMVNVEGAGTASPAIPAVTSSAGNESLVPTPLSPMTGSPLSNVASPSSDSTKISAPEVASPAAKAIVAIDAIETKHKKTRSASTTKDSINVKRFFSLHKKPSNPDLVNSKKTPEKAAPSSVPRSNFRDKIRLLGTPQAARREDKRRSID